MGQKLCDLSLRTMLRMLRATERFAGSDCQSVALLRRAVAQKRQEEKEEKAKNVKRKKRKTHHAKTC